MALPNEVNVGTAPNNDTGDPLRTGGQKINANFVYLDENKQGVSEKGAANGYVGLNANVKIGNEYIQMPVLPVETVPATGEENVLYVENSTKELKVWNGTAYDLYGGGSVTYQDVIDALGYTPENVANKTTDYSTINNTLYPTTQATEGRYTQIGDFNNLEVRVSDNEDDIENHEIRITALEAEDDPQEPISVIWNTGDPTSFELPRVPSAIDINGTLLSKWLEDGVTPDEWSLSGTTVALNGITPEDGDNVQFHFDSSSITTSKISTGDIKLDLFTGRIYGDFSDKTGDIVVDDTSTELGGTALIYHKDSVEPNIMTSSDKITIPINGAYVAGERNLISISKIGNNRIGIIYNQIAQNSIFSDDFEGTTINTSKWNVLNPNPTKVSFTQNDELIIENQSEDSAVNSWSNRMESVDTFDEGILEFESSGASSSPVYYHGLYVDDNNFAVFSRSSGVNFANIRLFVKHSGTNYLQDLLVEKVDYSKFRIECVGNTYTFYGFDTDWNQLGNPETRDIGAAKKIVFAQNSQPDATNQFIIDNVKFY